MGSLTDKDRPTLIEELRGEIYLDIREEQNFYRPLSFNLKMEICLLPVQTAVIHTSTAM